MISSFPLNLYIKSSDSKISPSYRFLRRWFAAPVTENLVSLHGIIKKDDVDMLKDNVKESASSLAYVRLFKNLSFEVALTEYGSQSVAELNINVCAWTQPS